MKWYFLFQKMVCHGEHTYLYSQLLMHMLSHETKGGSNVRRLCQEVHRAAKQRWTIFSFPLSLHLSAVSFCCCLTITYYCRGLDVTPITLALSGAAKYPRACQALQSMLSRSSLNPADITTVSTVLLALLSLFSLHVSLHHHADIHYHAVFVGMRSFIQQIYNCHDTCTTLFCVRIPFVLTIALLHCCCCKLTTV